MKQTKSNYLRVFNSEINDLFRGDAKVSRIIDAFEKEALLSSNVANSSSIEPEEFAWMDNFERTILKLRTIIGKPRLHLKTIKEVLKKDIANKVDATGFNMTARDSKLWKMQDAEYIPEYVYANISEDEIAIYENRFIVTLMNTMYAYIDRNLQNLYKKIKKLDTLVAYGTINLGNTDEIHSCTQMNEEVLVNCISAGEASSNRPNVIPLLTAKDNPIIDTLKRTIVLQKKLHQLMDTHFYKVCAKAKPLAHTAIFPTNILNQDPEYSFCYNYYKQIMATHNTESKGFISKKHYENYVAFILVHALSRMGLTPLKKSANLLKLVNDRYVFENNEFGDKAIKVTLNTLKESEIEVKIEVLLNNTKGLSQKTIEKRTMKVLLILSANMRVKYNTTDKTNQLFSEMIDKTIHSGYDNCFIITAIDDIANSNNVITVSPNDYILDSNIYNLVKSFTLFLEGDSFIYSKRCPVCGSSMLVEEETNFECLNCSTLYSMLLDNSDDKGSEKEDIQELIWIKRMMLVQ